MMIEDPDCCPKAVEGLEINAVSDGYVVHDPHRDRIHYLNPTSAVLLELCTGAVPARDMPGLLQQIYELPEPPVVDVGECLAALRHEGLVV
jgi:Coenzyme PQQ synthesis protein D (PqqD)